MSCFDMFLVIMNKTIRILLLACLFVTCNRTQNPSGDITPADSSKYTDNHNHYSGKLKGTWYRNTLGSRATLTLDPISPERVQFSITALSGSHTGEIDGFLTIDGVKASYQTESEDFGSCLLLFDGSVEGSIRIEQEGCVGYGGVGVAFMGLYDRNWIPDETLAIAMLSERYGADVTREIQFMSGSDFDIVAASLQLEVTIESGDAFSDVSEYYARGLRGVLASCIAVNNESGGIWIAFVRDNKLLYSGELNSAPSGFKKWIDEITATYSLELVRKPDPT